MFNVYALKKGDKVRLTGGEWGSLEGVEATVVKTVNPNGTVEAGWVSLTNKDWPCMLVERDGKRVNSIIQAVRSRNLRVEFEDGSTELFVVESLGSLNGQWYQNKARTGNGTNQGYVAPGSPWNYIYPKEEDLKEAKEYFGDVPVTVERLERWLKEDRPAKPDLPEVGDRVRLTFADGHTEKDTVTSVDEKKNQRDFDNPFHRIGLENRLFPVWVFESKQDEGKHPFKKDIITWWKKVVTYKVGDVVPAYTDLGKRWLGRDGDRLALFGTPDGPHSTTDRTVEWMED